jgi:hypothetical protein
LAVLRLKTFKLVYVLDWQVTRVEVARDRQWYGAAH